MELSAKVGKTTNSSIWEAAADSGAARSWNCAGSPVVGWTCCDAGLSLVAGALPSVSHLVATVRLGGDRR